MNVTYQDRNGKSWGFDLNATPYQAVLFRRVLCAVRTVAQRVALTLPYLADVENNDAFLSDVEGTVLSALSERFAAGAPQDPPPPKPQAPPRHTQRAEPALRDPYYWEKF